MAEVVMTEYGRADFSSEARVHALDVFVLLRSRPGAGLPVDSISVLIGKSLLKDIFLIKL